ncbi:Heparanase-like protein 1 [Diplonema papillatum]|nr:Heparanase-like protein 1 [Diplonema papillatum]|eukprot:gene16975-26045_t
MLSVVLAAWAVGQMVVVSVNETAVHQTVSEDFVCVGMDWWPSNKCNYGVCPWGNASIINANLQDERIIKAVQMLDKPIIRMGGTQGDTIVYKVGDPVPDCPSFSPAPPTVASSFTGGCLTMERWDEIYEFTQKTGAKLAFGLSARYGRQSSPQSPWDPSNALALMKYTVAKGYDHIFAYEWANELSYSAQMFSDGIHQVHDAINDAYTGSSIAPPKIVSPDYISWNATLFEELLPLVQDVAFALSWHDYPLGAGYDNPNLDQKVMDPNQNSGWTKDAEQGVALSKKVNNGKVKMWMGESGGAYNSGHNGTSNRFEYAFWYIDSMAAFAAAGQDAFCRQAFLGGNYELLDHRTNLPNPDFFGAVLFKKLLGPRVLAAASNSTDLHAYAQCTPGTSGNVTVLMLNYGAGAATVSLPPAAAPTRQEYHLRGHGGVLNSSHVDLNGEMLTIDSELSPAVVAATGPVSVAGQSYAFVVYKGTGVCGN